MKRCDESPPGGGVGVDGVDVTMNDPYATSGEDNGLHLDSSLVWL